MEENEIKKRVEDQKWQQNEKERNNMQESINEWKKRAENGASIRYSHYAILFFIEMVSDHESTIDKFRVDIQALNQNLASLKEVHAENMLYL